MKDRVGFSCLLLMSFFLALAPTALASVWYVDGVNGNDNNDCKTRQTACKTIGHAISLASSGDTIGIGPASYTENLTVGFSLNIVGSGATTTIINGGGVGTVVTIPNTGTHVTLSKLTVRNGFGRGGGINNGGTLTINNSTLSGNDSGGFIAFGGGIYNGGTLTINNSSISGNSAAVLREALGGGIYNGGTLTINNSTISGNTADAGSALGAGIYNGGTLTINNSTISGNTARGDNFAEGGGIDNPGGTLTINNSTLSENGVVNNSALSGNGAVSGSGINNGGTAILRNSIVADNIGSGNCSGTITSNGYNLSNDGSCHFSGPGDLDNTDPKLGPLQNNGGPTQTMALLPGSPAIDSGNPAGCTDSQGHLLKTDQRGAPRPDKEDTGGCDRGAFERQQD